MRPRIQHRPQLRKLAVPDGELVLLRRRNDDQAAAITGLQKALREARREIDELKQAHLKELMRHSNKPRLL